MFIIIIYMYIITLFDIYIGTNMHAWRKNKSNKSNIMIVVIQNCVFYLIFIVNFSHAV